MLDLVRNFSGKVDKYGICALVWLFRSNNIDKINFDADGFRELFWKEKNMVDDNGYTILMHLCSNCPQLLDDDFWFVPELLL